MKPRKRVRGAKTTTSRPGQAGVQALSRSTRGNVGGSASQVPQLFLRSRLARVRELPNGFDFFFTGDPAQLDDNAHAFISSQSSSARFLNFDHTLIENTLLLRITGTTGKKKLIRKYFESQ